MRQREPHDQGGDAFEAALLEERPEISREFAAELDAWAAEGFPRVSDFEDQGANRPAGPRPLARLRDWFVGIRPLRLALVGASVVVLGATVVTSALLTESDEHSGSVSESLSPDGGGGDVQRL